METRNSVNKSPPFPLPNLRNLPFFKYHPSQNPIVPTARDTPLVPKLNITYHRTNTLTSQMANLEPKLGFASYAVAIEFKKIKKFELAEVNFKQVLFKKWCLFFYLKTSRRFVKFLLTNIK
ncbi:MAG: hypothetical protein ACJATF_003413 [Flavobacteriales bacterium]|jgi:hypothetical protein